MAKSVSLTGTQAFTVTDTASSKKLVNFTFNPNISITTDSLDYGEISVDSTTAVALNLTTPGAGHYVYVEVVSDDDSAECTLSIGSTSISTLAIGEFSFLKVRSGSNITVKQNTSQTEPVIVKYFIIEY